MKALIVTPDKTEIREFNDIFEFLNNLKREFNWFIVNFEFDKEYDLEIWVKGVNENVQGASF
jgi:hypothetical protein